MRCRNDQNIAEILSKRRQQNSFQVVHFTSARRFDDGQPPALPKPSGSACEPYRQFIEQGLARGRNAMAIWQDLVSDRGFTACYQTVKRFVLKPRGTQCTSDVRSLEVSAAYFISFLSFMSEGAFAAKLCCRMRAPRQIPVEGIFVFRVGVFVKTNRLRGHLSVWPKCAGGPLPKG